MRMQSLVHGEYPRETISLVNQLMNVYLVENELYFGTKRLLFYHLTTLQVKFEQYVNNRSHRYK